MTGSDATRGGFGLWLYRIWILSTNTFTQLLRMKALYFLLIFSLLIVVASTFNVFSYAAEQQLKLLKDVALGAMTLFTSIFAIVATAMLLPRDIEDRTLYTILAKPVPRGSYLLGRLGGVFLLLAVTLVLMDVVFGGVLTLRQTILLQGDFGGGGSAPGEVAAEISDASRDAILAQGLSWNLQGAVLVIFFKGCVAASATLLVSTIASSSLFTIIVSLAVFFIGHVQAIARDYWVAGSGESVFGRLFAALVALLFPDFQLFNVVDSVVAGELIALSVLAKLAGITALYVAIYSLVACIVFSDKEF